MIRYRPASDDDVDSVVALVESAYRGVASRQGWTTEADLLDGQRTDPAGVREVIDRPGARMLLATDDQGMIVGCCQLERRQLERRPGSTGYLGMFAVRPGLQGRGLGRAIVAEAERAAASWPAVEMRMSVLAPRTDLIAWYARLGYAPNGETEPFPYGDERYGRPRVTDLHFVVLAKTLDARG